MVLTSMEPDPDGRMRPRKKVKAVQSKGGVATGEVGIEKSSKYLSLKQKAQSLLPLRQKLPIWSQADTIRKALREKDVLLLVGETGSGKSTQIPQFLLDEPWCKPNQVQLSSSDGEAKTVKVGGCIAVTEPRRVAAITLARRVAEEMGTPLGSSSPASRVGYSVRFDNSTSPSTRIKFLTEGMLLQEMLRDPWLRQYSVVVVDEVHERSVNVDLILGFMRQMQDNSKGRGGQPLKVVVMSATADTGALLKLFDGDSHGAQTNGKQISHNQDEEEESEWSGFSDTDDSMAAYRNHSHVESKASLVHIEGRQFPVKVIHSPEPIQDFVDTALRTIFQIHYKEPLPGDILVFLTGQETIESLEALVNDYALGLGPELPRLLVLPLFAALPQTAQQQVFRPTPPRTRKVILSTNIAETSVTVSGVRYVIDCGKSKYKQFRASLGLDSLLVKPVSKSAAIQRKGRAGREAAGQCYRLYTEQGYENMQNSNTPEILRCDLAQAILNMKARGVDNIWNFPFLDKPQRRSLEGALLQLLQLGALEESGRVSDIGLKISRLPVSAPLGTALMAAMEESDCLAEVVDIISCLSVENVFPNLTSEDDKEKAEAARRSLFRREGDHLTLLATVQAYAAENTDRKSWAEKHFVSHRAMQAVMVSRSLRVETLADCAGCSETAKSPSRRAHEASFR